MNEAESPGDSTKLSEIAMLSLAFCVAGTKSPTPNDSGTTSVLPSGSLLVTENGSSIRNPAGSSTPSIIGV